MRTRSQGYMPPPPPPPPPPGYIPRPFSPSTPRHDEPSEGSFYSYDMQQQQHSPEQEQEEQQQQQQQQQKEQQQRQERQQQIPPRWILRVRCTSSKRGSSSSSADNFHYGRPIARVEISHRTSDAILADCLQHVLQLDSDNNNGKVAGLFVEETGLFRSLLDILQEKPTPQYIYSMCLPPRAPKPIPWWQHSSTLWWIVGLCSILPLSTVCLRIYEHSELIFQVVTEFIVWLYSSAIQIPLADLYRHAPFIGWQGYRDMPHICSRMTRYGDAVFWSRNMDDCHRIYQDAEQSFLSVARPTVHATVVLTILWMIVSLIRTALLEQRRRDRNNYPPPDKDMLETYRALNILLRQVKRTWGDSSSSSSSHSSRAR